MFLILTSFVIEWAALEAPSELGVLELDPHEELRVVALVQERAELREALVGRGRGLLFRLVVRDVVQELEHPVDS